MSGWNVLITKKWNANFLMSLHTMNMGWGHDSQAGIKFQIWYCREIVLCPPYRRAAPHRGVLPIWWVVGVHWPSTPRPPPGKLRGHVFILHSIDTIWFLDEIYIFIPKIFGIHTIKILQVLWGFDDVKSFFRLNDHWTSDLILTTAGWASSECSQGAPPSCSHQCRVSWEG